MNVIPLRWLTSYINRKQYACILQQEVRYNLNASELKMRVPQGPILGLIQSTLYVNDLENNISLLIMSDFNKSLLENKCNKMLIACGSTKIIFT